ncbi:MAG TPA: acyl-CoA desaturase [Flavobacteriales bacterium]|nr:acyl-CoA desaturase [Flavobacteriales bacterium]
MSNASIRFNTQQRLFFKTAKSRVDEYFKTNKISKSGNWTMAVKTIVLLGIYFVPYAFMVGGYISSLSGIILVGIAMGFGMASIGLSVMHDANHGSYSKNQHINRLLSYTLNMLGGHYLNWRLQHNELHHTFTNIHDHDEDIAPVGILRFSPHAPLKKVHRFQFIYAWFFYGFMTFMWVTTKDFVALKRYRDMGLLKTKNISYRKHLIALIVGKLLYYIYMVGIPVLVTGLPVLYVLIGFAVLHFVAGLTLAAIFQPAHVIEETNFPIPDATGNMENDWAVHQLYTTANFAPKSRITSWFIGGLNYQVEHHLFPSICHIHYRKLSKIVRTTAQEFNLPYHEKTTFFTALISHTKTLMRLGKPLTA